MIFSKNVQNEIYSLIDIVVQKYIDKAIDKPKANSGNPFVMALLKDFEPLIHRIHGLKTSLGTEMEKIAQIIAIDAWGEDNIKRKIRETFELPKNALEKIDTIINNLSNIRNFSDYIKEKNEIINECKKPSKTKESLTFEYDLILNDPQIKRTFILEMKGPDPNTTEVPGAKRRLLAAIAWTYLNIESENIDSQLAIYYNNKYPKAYENPKVHKYFSPEGGILVQEDFWNFIGKNDRTFESLAKMFEDYGKQNKKKIWEGFSKLIDIK